MVKWTMMEYKRLKWHCDSSVHVLHNVIMFDSIVQASWQLNKVTNIMCVRACACMCACMCVCIFMYIFYIQHLFTKVIQSVERKYVPANVTCIICVDV